MSRTRKATDRTELVETHEIAKALKRLRDVRPYDDEVWRRSLYHALGMMGLGHGDTKKIREALGLP